MNGINDRLSLCPTRLAYSDSDTPQYYRTLSRAVTQWRDGPIGGETVMTDPDWDDVSFVISSRYRVAAMRRLDEGPSTPSNIADDASVGLAHVSRALQELRESELVDLLVSDERKKGRVYGLTEEGDRVWQTIEAENMV
ncbi:ArsR family transcriptional regulator [Halomicrobium sp. ZPS1]|uniref:HVO-A0261-like N-terminal domain-containing protein n=3 Tax=Haloarculaceae TaxID=1963268 RepID=C7NW17_HALMD|nr:hypothetical protein Hmuk_2033 [Halomicrobium mukohataei DSM 12286]QCD66570.1 winged helix-turn-helix transcriptional regulator [Halomicrobium mukohataei]QFR21376.1 ArsR family transcriptional regulator [Halomicrobium sp. ZPS1]